MRRRLSWAVMGTSGVLAVVVAAMIAATAEEAGPQIIVPVAADAAGLDVADSAKTKPSTVFIETVPPVAVTSVPTATTPAPSPRAVPRKTTSAKPAVPTKNVPTTNIPETNIPVPQANQSIWDLYRAYLDAYRQGGHSPRDGDWRRRGGR